MSGDHYWRDSTVIFSKRWHLNSGLKYTERAHGKYRQGTKGNQEHGRGTKLECQQTSRNCIAQARDTNSGA